MYLKVEGFCTSLFPLKKAIKDLSNPNESIRNSIGNRE